MVRHQEYPWNLLAKLFSQRRREILPHVSSSSELIASNEQHLSNYPVASKKIVVFDKYQDISAKDHDRMLQASGAKLDNDLSIASHLP